MNEKKQIEEMRPHEIKELVDLLVDYGRNYDDSIQGCEDTVAELIVTNGYRKTSAVVDEIVDYLLELEKIERLYAGEREALGIRYAIKKIQKKYTEDINT